MRLHGAVNDAVDMCGIAHARGFRTSLLLNGQATLDAFGKLLNAAQSTLKAGDTLLITYSGHGDDLRINSGDNRRTVGIPDCRDTVFEQTGRDQLLCLFDGKFIDNEFRSAWCGFKEGVRIILITDSCMSGTLTAFKNMQTMQNSKLARATESTIAARTSEGGTTVKSYTARFLRDGADPRPHEGPSSTILSTNGRIERQLHNIPPTVLHISASQDNTTTKDAGAGERNSRFTAALLKAWSSPPGRDTYTAFYRRITSEAVKTQPHIRPNYTIIGRSWDLISGLEAEQPFSL